MINIIREENHNFKDCHNYRYDIFNELCHLYFYQKGSRDLAMRFLKVNQNNLIKITKENYLLYKAI